MNFSSRTLVFSSRMASPPGALFAAVFVAAALLMCMLSSLTATHALMDNSDLVTTLPGYPGGGMPPFKNYAGYLEIDPSGRDLFYWYVEAQTNPSTAPLVLWLNGGPGCSSLAGLLEENGPYWATKDGEGLQINPYAWNTIANVLYVESPAGVGFSYFTNPADNVVGDNRTAHDTFFAKYPELQGRDFYLSGESYAGHYNPNNAVEILRGNKDARNIKINLKGVLLGNPLLLLSLDGPGQVETWWRMNVISNETYTGLMKYCYKTPDDNQCDHYQDVASNEMGDISPYDLYEDVCVASSDRQVSRLARLAHHADRRSAMGVLHRLHEKKQRNMRLHDQVGSGDIPSPPCIDNWLVDYFNRKDVQDALHATRRQLPANFKWDVCSDSLGYIESDIALSMIPALNEIFQSPSVRVIIYQGDVDSVCPFAGTREVLKLLNLKTIKPFHSWQFNQQVAGRAVVYDKITWTSVRWAGHLVPADTPARALEMLRKFIANEQF